MAERTCSAEGCERSIKARGLCQKHYDATPERRERDAARGRARWRADPEYRARRLSRSAERRVPATPKTLICPTCGDPFPRLAANQRYCSKGCRPVKKGRKSHSHQWHYEIIGAKLHTGQLVELRLKQNEWGGFLVPCPQCRCIMGIRDVDTKYDRWCMWCEIPLSLDEGDVEWANYVMLSKSPSLQAA